MRLLIVDDEHYIVNYLADLIGEYLSSDLEVLKCYSGMEAMTLLQSTQVDIMLLDIHMPGISGLDLAEKVRDLLPNCRILFLTAYDNFDHIYKSNKLTHTRYLLKTESDQVILSEISRTIDEINEEANTLLLLSDAQQKTLLLSHLLQQNILKGIFTGQTHEMLKGELHLAGSDFPLDLNSPVYLMYTQVHYKTLDESVHTVSAYTLQYLQLVKKLLLDRFMFSMLDIGGGMMLWFFQPCTSVSSEIDFLKTMANDFRDYCTSHLRRHVTAVLFPKSSSWDEVCNHFSVMHQYAESSVSAVPLTFSSVNILEDDNYKADSSTDSYTDRSNIEHRLQELSFFLYQNSETEYFTILNEIQADCVKIRSMHDLKAIRIYTSVSLMLMKYIDLYHLQEKIISTIALYPLYYLQDFPSWREAFLYIQKLSAKIFQILKSQKSDRNALLIQNIKSFVDEHIKETLTLTTISRFVNYNEAYVSRLFKQLTGVGLSEYISLERIKKAKHLLSTTNESIQNIASETGFDTAQYFSIVFKKTTGISPSEYRRLH